MTPLHPKWEKPAVLLSYAQFDLVMWNLGWGPEDKDAFLHLAQREMERPDSLAQEIEAYRCPVSGNVGGQK